MRFSGRMSRGLAAVAAAIAVCALIVAVAVIALPSAPGSLGGDSRFNEVTPADLDTRGQSESAAPASVPEPAYLTATAEVSEEDVPELVGDYESSVVLVQLANGWTADELNRALSHANSVQHVSITDEDLELGFAALSLADGYDVAHAIAELQQLPAVDAAQPNYLYRLTDDGLNNERVDSTALAAGVISALRESGSEFVPTIVTQATTTLNDEYASQQWALSSIHAYDAWDIVKAGDTGEGRVSVAVLDNGFLVTHEDLAANIVATYNTNDGGTDVPAIYNGHGTHVCGIVSAVANNAKGVAGVSYNAGLVPIQVFKYETWEENGQSKSGVVASSTRLYDAYQYIMDNENSGLNIRVVNMSLGGAMKANAKLERPDNLLVSAVNSAFNKGILTVCAAGNDAGGVAYSAFPVDWLDKALGVIALENGTPPTRPDYSNYNTSDQTTKDISAPGSAIYSTYAYASSDATNTYLSISGTSMASPCVAGVAALVFAANENLSADDVAKILCSTATDLGAEGWDEGYGAGEVNACDAVEAAMAANLIGDSIMLKGGTTTLIPSRSGTWTWTTSNAGIASVASEGVVTGVGAGTATITATSGSTSASKDITVYDISFSGPCEASVGGVATLTFNENPDTELWYIGVADTHIAQCEVTSDGVYVRGIVPGKTTITATSASNSNLVVEYPFTVIGISGADAMLAGAQATLVPTAGDGMLDDEWHWSTSDADVATVSSGGVVTGVAAGTATITATSATRSLSKSVTVYEAAFDGDDEVKAGSSIALTFAAAPAGSAWTISSSNTARASVTDNGDGTVTVTGISAGEVDVVATLNGAEGIEVRFSLTVLESDARYSLREGRVQITWPNYSDSFFYYSGKAKEPVPQRVTYRSGPNSYKALEKDVDYFVTYSSNVNAGTAHVYITGMGDYKDSYDYSFTINQYPLQGATKTSWFIFTTTIVPAVSVSGSVSAVYTGRPHTPSPTLSISVDGEYTLQDGIDYDLEYSDNVNAGTAKVMVTGKGNFTGSRTYSFPIAKADFSQASVSVNGWVYDTAAHKPEPTVVLGERTLSAGDDYTVAYADNKSAGTCTVTVTPTDTLNYTGAAVGTCEVTPAPISSATIAPMGDQTYTGAALTPAPVVTFAGTTLVNGTDYTLSYADNVSVGTATVTLTGKGNFTGTAQTTFAIVEKGASEGGSSDPSGSSDPTDPAADGIIMFRLYNPNSYEHFYTSNAEERANLVSLGWRNEGEGWVAPKTGTPVYRLYNPNNGGDHHYTTDTTERAMLIAAGWRDEGIGWYSAGTDGVAVYREYNPNEPARNHNYTRDRAEHDKLLSFGWRDEGIAWYGL